MKKAIVGYGSFAREVQKSIENSENIIISNFIVDDQYYENQPNLIKISEFNPEEYEVIVAVANPTVRKNLIDKLPKNTKYFSHIHKSVIVLDDSIQIGVGSIICAGCILTTNIVIGDHSQLNLQTTIGHDCSIGDFFTTAPGVKISGNCNIGNQVYFGTNSCTKEKIRIVDNVTVGLNGGVVKNINESGIYVGTPTKKIEL